MDTSTHRKILKGVTPFCSLVFLVAIAHCMAHNATADEVKVVDVFLQTHCVRCHNEKKTEGELNLDDMAIDVAASRANFAAVLEQLRAGDMPPEDEPQPKPVDVDRVVKWIQAGLAALPAEPQNTTRANVRPHEGNHVPHSLLFGGKPGPSVPPPARLWRLSPQGYAAGLLRSVQVDAQRIPQPFALREDAGLKDYAALYWIDEGSTDILIRNAENIVKVLTSHKLSTPKDGGPVRVSLNVRSWFGERIRPPAEFEPLLHPENVPTREQLEAAIRVMYRMVLIREPSGEEIESLVALHAKCSESPGDPVSASTTMLMAPLLSPEALHRFEVGRGAEVREGVRMLSPVELAYAVSLAFSGRREQGLFEAAADGGLKSREDVEKHVRRILNDPEIYKPRMLGFFHEYFGYDRAPDVCKDEQPDYVHRPEQLVLDTDRLVLDILEKDQDVLKELLTTRKSYVNGVWLNRDGERASWNLNDSTVKKYMAAHIDSRFDRYVLDKPSMTLRPKDGRKANTEAAYGLDEWPAKQPVDLPGDRIGVLMQPSWLVAWSSNFFNDPVRRGLWIREHLLGQPVPPVPVGVVIVLPDDPQQTLRQRMQITKDQACWKCHQKIDDLGFPFEAFDHFGRPRQHEISFDMEAAAQNQANAARTYEKGEQRPDKLPEYHQLPLETTGNVLASGDPKLDGPVENAAEMIRKLAESDRVRQVFIRYVFRYFMGRNETPGDAATLQEADRVYVESGGSFNELVVSLLTSESFMYRTVPEQTNVQISNAPTKNAP
jgi:hypothetical protein